MESIEGSRNVLLEEYKLLLARWDAWDARSLTMRGWITAGAVAGLTQLPKICDPFVLYSIAFVVGFAWLTEGSQRVLQSGDHPRIVQLERLLAGEKRTSPAPRIAASAAAEFARQYEEYIRQRFGFLPSPPQAPGQWLRREIMMCTLSIRMCLTSGVYAFPYVPVIVILIYAALRL